MVEKYEILEELGEEKLLLPALVNAALRANDRIKYYFTLIQAARNHADDPGQNHSNLRAERESVGIPDPDLDTVVGGATRMDKNGYAIPLISRIFSEAGDRSRGNDNPACIAGSRRSETVWGSVRQSPDIPRLTRGRANNRGSHRYHYTG